MIIGDIGDLGRIIAELIFLRVALGLSQADVAAAVGVCADTVSDWERGRKAPGARNLIAWAAFLGRRVVIVPDTAPPGATPEAT